MNWLIKYKKILLAIVFVLAIFIFGFLLYLLFFKPSQPAVITEEMPVTTGRAGLPLAQPSTGQIALPSQGPAGLLPAAEQLPQANPTAQGGLTQTSELNQTPSLGATLAANGRDLLYYDREDGKFYRVTKDGQATLLSDVVFNQVQKITWSPDKTRAILEYPDRAKIIYNFSANKQISLPKHWQDFDFSPDGSRIVMKSLGDNQDNRWLAVIDSQGTDAKKVAALGDKNETVYPSWSPNNQTVAMFTEGVSLDEQNVFFVGLNDENFKALTIEGRGFEPKWSPAGDRLLYSVYSSDNGLKPELWLTQAQGENIGAGRLKLNLQTWADKCVFASAADVYCAVPQQLEEGSGLFPELAKGVKDNLYKINVQTGLKKLMAIPDGYFTMSNLIVSADGSYLYFTDEDTERLNKIKLK
jgi:hypothetical protein